MKNDGFSFEPIGLRPKKALHRRFGAVGLDVRSGGNPGVQLMAIVSLPPGDLHRRESQLLKELSWDTKVGGGLRGCQQERRNGDAWNNGARRS